MAFDGKPVSGIDELHRHLVANKIGVSAKLDVIRYTEKLNVAITREDLAPPDQQNGKCFGRN